MKSEIIINEPEKERDYYPSLFSNKDNTIVILATERTSEKTFSGVVVFSENETKKGTFGLFSTGWTFEQFKRLPKRTEINLKLFQED